ncbi:MAG: phage holin family protein [Clostridia bacterium]|nr:phage holin family protein [Clostridia bacterium]
MDYLKIKTIFYTAVCAVGGILSSLFGGLDMSLVTLIVFMGVDYLTGLIVAGVFHRSGKSESGSLESRAGWKGLLRKGVTLLVVLVAARLDIMLGVSFVRDAAVLAYIVNEVLSIIENAGLMGIPIPAALKNAIEALSKKGGEKE